MPITEIDRATGLASSAAYKAPCQLATTANITLAAEQAIDGTLTAESRVLVKNQTDATLNGIYITSSGLWQRAPDFSRNDQVREGTRVWVTDGATNAQSEWVVTSDEIDLDASNLAFANSNSLIDASRIHAATAKATLADADEVGIWDSVTGLFKKATIAVWKTIFLPIVGGTLTGQLVINDASANGNPAVFLDKAASGKLAYLVAKTNGLLRWVFYLSNNAAESGSNAGSDVALYRYDDAGTVIDLVLSISRSAAAATGSLIATAGNYLANTAGKLLTVDKAWAAAVPQSLGAALTGNLTLDLGAFINAYGTATGNITFNAVSNLKYQSGVITITASGGDRTVGFNTSVFATPDNVSLGTITSGTKVAFSYYRDQAGKIVLMRLGAVS